MCSSISHGRPRAVANAALLAAAVTLSGCGEMHSRGDFEALVRDRSDKEVAAKVGKPGNIDESRPDHVRWTYTSRTFSIESGNKRDATTIVIFGRAPDGTLKARDVLFE